MLPLRSISSLYPLALAEGEGIGTAYEYYAKRLVLARWLASLRPPQRLLIVRLPEKCGKSLDFILLARDWAVTDARQASMRLLKRVLPLGGEGFTLV